MKKRVLSCIALFSVLLLGISSCGETEELSVSTSSPTPTSEVSTESPVTESTPAESVTPSIEPTVTPVETTEISASPSPTPTEEPALHGESGYGFTLNTSDKGYIYNVENAVYLRSSPDDSDDSNIIATIPAGTEVTLLDLENSDMYWCYYGLSYSEDSSDTAFSHVSCNGTEGYVKSGYISCYELSAYGTRGFQTDFSYDLDLDGQSEEVRFVSSPDTYESSYEIWDNGKLVSTVAANAEYCTCVYVMDFNQNGYPEIYFGFDYASSDYCVYCMEYKNGSYQQISFDSPEIDINTYDSDEDEASSDGCTDGALVYAENGTLYIWNRMDLIGTYYVQIPYSYDKSTNRFCQKSSDILTINIMPNFTVTLYTSSEITAQIDGSNITVPVGTDITPYSISVSQDNKEVTFYFTSSLGDGSFLVTNSGKINDSNAINWTIDGISIEDCFEYLYYYD